MVVKPYIMSNILRLAASNITFDASQYPYVKRL